MVYTMPYGGKVVKIEQLEVGAVFKLPSMSELEGCIIPPILEWKIVKISQFGQLNLYCVTAIGVTQHKTSDFYFREEKP